MAQDSPADYYEALQISTSADPETIHRVYRFLAQRFHPDNKETGNAIRFRLLSEAHRILVARGVESENDFGIEQSVRLTVLEVLYTRRRVEPYAPGLFGTDLEKMIGRPREHLEFTTWYLIQKNLIQRSDNSLLMITAEGIDHLEGHYRTNAPTGRLRAVNE
jgi:hypothetical protein